MSFGERLDFSRKQKSLLYYGVSTLIIALLVYFADVQKFVNSVKSAQALPLSIGIGFGILGLSVLGFTWHRFLNKIDLGTSYVESFRIFMAGQFMNSVTPLGQLGGEPVMAYIIKDTQDTSYEEALSAVVSADIVNTVPYITFMLGGSAYLLLFDSLNSTVAQTAGVTLLITILGGLMTYILWFRAELLERKLTALTEKLVESTGRGRNRAEELQKRLRHLRETFDTIGEDPKHLAFTAAVAHIFFVLQVCALFFVILSVGKSADLSSLYFVIAVSSLANFSPTPGGSGTFEAAMAGVLTVFTSIGFADALTIGILHRIATYWSGLLIGYVSLTSLRSDSGFDEEDMNKELKKKEQVDL